MDMGRLSMVDLVALILVIIGGLNWGLVGIGGLAGIDLNLVNIIFGVIPALENIIYLVVGISAIYTIYILTR